jgi:hypothetical protein
MSTGREIRLTEDEDGHWMARDVDAEVTADGPTRDAALDALDEALADGDDETEPRSPATSVSAPTTPSRCWSSSAIRRSTSVTLGTRSSRLHGT